MLTLKIGVVTYCAFITFSVALLKSGLGGLRTADGQELPVCLKAEITRECQRLHQVIVMIAEVEAEQAAALDAEEGSIFHAETQP